MISGFHHFKNTYLITENVSQARHVLMNMIPLLEENHLIQRKEIGCLALIFLALLPFMERNYFKISLIF